MTESRAHVDVHSARGLYDRWRCALPTDADEEVIEAPGALEDEDEESEGDGSEHDRYERVETRLLARRRYGLNRRMPLRLLWGLAAGSALGLLMRLGHGSSVAACLPFGYGVVAKQ